MVDSDDSEQLAKLFHALSHPIRIQIASLLLDGEHCVQDILDLCDANQQANVSQHLSILKKAGIVRSHRDGQHVIYSICCRQMQAIIGAARLARCRSSHAPSCPDACRCKLSAEQSALQ